MATSLWYFVAEGEMEDVGAGCSEQSEAEEEWRSIKVMWVL